MDTIIELQNVTKTFKNKSVLEGVSLSIPSRQVTAIVGKNGSGKSTLLKMIGGLTKPDSGQILFRKRRAYPDWIRTRGDPCRYSFYSERVSDIHGENPRTAERVAATAD